MGSASFSPFLGIFARDLKTWPSEKYSRFPPTYHQPTTLSWFQCRLPRYKGHLEVIPVVQGQGHSSHAVCCLLLGKTSRHPFRSPALLFLPSVEAPSGG